MSKRKKYHVINNICQHGAGSGATFVSYSKQHGNMKGVIYHTNASRSMYSAQLSDGSFAVFELVDPVELDTYTGIAGEFDSRGDREVVVNDKDKLHIHIDHCGLSEMAAFHKTFLNE